jgi:Pyruvate/2-oxoacid:ferredoxin oxidoreductase gamma subunit
VRLVGITALLSGLRATQRDDYPITIKSGHSVSELVLSPDEIFYTGISRPDALVILSEDGYRKVAHYLPHMTAADRLFVLPPFAGVETEARVTVLDPGRAPLRPPKTNIALAILAAVLRQMALFPAEALEQAARLSGKQYVDDNLKAIAAGFAMAEIGNA